MTGLKFLFRRSFSPLRMGIPALIGVALLVLVMVFHEPMQAEDYLLCKLMAHIGTMFVSVFSCVFLSAEMCGTRLIRSSPISKELRRFSIPVYNIILGTGVTVLVNIIYAVFILVTGQDIQHISDMLIISAPVCAIFTLLGTVSMQITWGMIVMIYAYIPAALLLGFVPHTVWENGFGIELWVSLLIYIGTAVVTSVLAFVISRIFYKKYDFHAMQQNATAV